jgi:phosphate acetyltransferase
MLCFQTSSQVPNNLSSKIKTIIIDKYDLASLANELYELRKEKGMTIEEANQLVKMTNYFCTMMLKKQVVDGYVGGIEMTTKDTLKPALQIIKTDKSSKIVTSAFIMERGTEKYL